MVLELPETLTLRYTVWVRLIPILFVGLVAFFTSLFAVQRFALPNAVCWGTALVTALLFFPLWQRTARSTIEVTAQGITGIDWRGKRQAMIWAEIEALSYGDMGGTLVLHHREKAQKLKISSQREGFPILSLLLVAYCPHLWRREESVSFHRSRAGWFFIFLFGSMALWFGWEWFQSPEQWLLAGFALLLLAGAIGFAYVLTMRLTITSEGVAIQAWRKRLHIPFSMIDTIGWTSTSRSGATYYSPIITLNNQKAIGVGGYGDSVTLFCVLMRTWLDRMHKEIMVRWGL